MGNLPGRKILSNKTSIEYSFIYVLFFIRKPIDEKDIGLEKYTTIRLYYLYISIIVYCTGIFVLQYWSIIDMNYSVYLFLSISLLLITISMSTLT